MQEVAISQKKKPLFGLSLIIFYLVAFGFAIFAINYFGTIKSDIILFRSMRPGWLLVALLAQTGTYYFNALVYQVLLRLQTKKASFSLKILFQASIVMLFLNQMVPSAGITGNAFFSRLLTKKGVAVEKALSVVLLVLLTSYTTMTLIIGSLIITGLSLNFPHLDFIILAIGLLVFGLLATIIAFAGRKKTIDYILDKISRVDFIRRALEKYRSMAAAESNKTQGPVEILASQKTIALEAITSKIGIVACDVLTIYALFSGLGISISPLTVILCYTLTQIITLVPTLPGSLVVYEGGLAFFFTQMAIPLETAATVVILYRFLSFWLPMPFGFILYKNLEKKSKSILPSNQIAKPEAY